MVNMRIKTNKYKKSFKHDQLHFINRNFSKLEAFSVDNAGARLVIFLLGDPHLLEGGKRSKDGSSDPDRVFPLWRSDDLDLHCGWGKGGHFLLHTVSDTLGRLRWTVIEKQWQIYEKLTATEIFCTNPVRGGTVTVSSLTGVHCGSSGHDDVGVKILSNINITLHDGVVGGLMDTGRFHSNKWWLEEGLRASESLVGDSDNLSEDIVG